MCMLLSRYQLLSLLSLSQTVTVATRFSPDSSPVVSSTGLLFFLFLFLFTETAQSAATCTHRGAVGKQLGVDMGDGNDLDTIHVDFFCISLFRSAFSVFFGRWLWLCCDFKRCAGALVLLRYFFPRHLFLTLFFSRLVTIILGQVRLLLLYALYFLLLGPVVAAEAKDEYADD